MEQKDATMCGLEKILEEKNIEKEEVEATLHEKIMDLEIQRKKECLAAVNAELQLRFKIRELCEKVLQSNLDKKISERKQRESDAKSENMEAVLNGTIKELEKQLEGYRVAREQEKKEERCAENGQMVDTLNTVINRVQKERQEAASKSQDALGHPSVMGAKKRCERENVEAEHLNKNFHIRNSDKKEGESAVCGQMEKLVTAAVVMVVYFINHGVNRG